MREWKITPIVKGTVIDHIPAGMGLKVLKVLGLDVQEIRHTVSLGIHVRSAKLGWKDILKIEERELKKSEVDKIALIAPGATISIIEKGEVKEKFKVSLPKRAKGIMRCPNPNCISNTGEPVEHEFFLVSEKPVKYRCKYCERILEDVLRNII
ncbi:MAG: aspartate carbamoyltransferase regulatory subunit [Thermoplasmata archaeon]